METVLIVENENILRTLYKEELEDEGYCVLLAKDEGEALDILKERFPDLVITEYQIETTESYTTFLYLASKVRHIPVIIYTGYPYDFIIDYVWNGDVEYLSKSSNLGDLKNRIKRVLHHTHYDDNLLKILH